MIVTEVKRTERGWAGHFIMSHRCNFRRNTLLQKDNIEIVVSTVGLMRTKDNGPVEEIGRRRYYETMAFYANPNDTRYHDADVTRQVQFNSEWSINEKDADDLANEMHEAVVSEITEQLVKGLVKPT